MTKPSTFFILGAPRSGTTLLQHLINAHSQICVCPEISSGRLLWRLNASRVINHSAKSILLLNHFYDRTRDLADPISTCFARHAIRHLRYPIKTEAWYSLLIDDYLKENQARIYGEKTPDNTYFVPVLSRVFPNSKYVVLTRNPFDIVLSLCEIAILKLKVPITNKLLLRFAVLVKRALHDLYVRKTIANEQHLFIEYEQLVTHTDETLEKICRFLGVDYEPGMKQIQHKKKYRSNRELMQLIHGRLDSPITTNRINRSFDVLTAQQITLLRRFLTPEIDYLPSKYVGAIVPLSFTSNVRLAGAKLAFHLRCYMLEEFKNKMRFQLHYFAIRFLGKSPLKRIIFKNLIYKDQEWERILTELE